MPVPDFNASEKYLIDSIKQSRAVSPYMSAYLTVGLLMFGFGLYHGNIGVMACAFFVLCGFRLYEEWTLWKWLPVYRSLIAKCEAAVREGPSDR